jgi:hypothetical protein
VFIFLERYDPEGGDPEPPSCERCGKMAEIIIEYRLAPGPTSTARMACFRQSSQSER